MKRILLILMIIAIIGIMALPTMAWDGYPDTPISEVYDGYIYQVIYKKDNSTFLIISKNPFYRNDNISDLDSFIGNSKNVDTYMFKYKNDNWEYWVNPGSFVAYHEILQSTHDIYTDSTLTEVFFTGMQFLANVNIVLPKDGYKDNSWIYTFWVYAELDTTTIDMDKLVIKVRLDGEPFPEEYYYDVTSNDITYYSNHIVSQLNFNVEIPTGEHTVTVIYMYNGEEIGRDSVNIERLSGFVDSDNDGLDDRTGMPDNSQKPIQYPDYEDVQTGVSGAIQELVSFLGASLQAVGQVGAFMKSVFAFLPREIVWLMTGLITVSVVIGIWKLIRG